MLNSKMQPNQNSNPEQRISKNPNYNSNVDHLLNKLFGIIFCVITTVSYASSDWCLFVDSSVIPILELPKLQK